MWSKYLVVGIFCSRLLFESNHMGLFTEVRFLHVYFVYKLYHMNFIRSLTRFVALVLPVVGLTLSSCNGPGSASESNTDTVNTSAADHSMHNADSTGAAGSNAAARAEADLAGTSADTVVNGKAVFDVSNGKVRMQLDLTVPSKAGQSVAVHFHEHGDCSNKGEMAHGHWNPTKTNHGEWGKGEFHVGDIGNIKLDASGKGSATIETDLWSIGGDSTRNILGKALIVHSGTDDYRTQPSGNSGSRIGCGVIQQRN
jgi:superoxide dismutase, Cu-Zn family